MRPTTTALKSSASATVLFSVVSSLTALSAPAMAQADEPKIELIENITVTARRREESLQSVPVAVSAFNDDVLQDLGALDLGGLQGAVPNLNLVQGRGSASSANIFIRGIGQPDALQTFDPGVGVYVDGVYFSRIQGALINLADIERVEVLRGPQGTLYGKNTIGGAVNLVSKQPDDQVHIKGNAAIGRFDHYQFSGYLSAPIIEGKLSASIAGSYEERDGVVRDPDTGEKFNDRDNLAGRIIVHAKPYETLSLQFSGDYTRQRNALNLGRAEADLTQTDLFTFGTTVLVPAPTTEYDFTGRTSFDLDDDAQELDHWGISLKADWDITDNITLTSISAYRDLETDFFIDIDATEFELGDVFVGLDQDQYSQELQAKYSNDWLSGVFGLYYLREDVTSDQIAFADDFLTFAGVPLAFTRTIADDQTTKSYAAFSQWTVDFTDQLSVTAGLRYTYEEKDYFRTTTSDFDFFAFTAEEDWDAWTPSLTVDFRPTDENLIYASVARGFKSGGFNGRANNAGSTSAFDPEDVWTIEAGTKNDFFDNRLRVNGAVFYNFYEDFQARVAGLTPTDFPVLNVAELDTWGVELEAIAVPIDHLTLATSVGYLNADYESFDLEIPGCAPEVCEPAFAPEWTFRASANYEWPVGPYGFVVFNGDVRHVSSHFLSVQNRDSLLEDGYTLLNAFVAIQDIDRVWRLAFGVKNITDEVYKTDGQEFSNVANIQTAYYGDPRTWQLSLTLDF